MLWGCAESPFFGDFHISIAALVADGAPAIVLPFLRYPFFSLLVWTLVSCFASCLALISESACPSRLFSTTAAGLTR